MIRYYFVYSLTHASPPLWDLFEIDGLLLSVDNVTSASRSKLSALAQDEGFLKVSKIIDSGAYRYISQGKSLDVDQVLASQVNIEFEFDQVVQLDFPLVGCETSSQVRVRIDKTCEMAGRWLAEFGPEKTFVVIHGRNKADLDYSFGKVRALQKDYGDLPKLALGSVAHLSGRAMMRVAALAHYCRLAFPAAELHTLGCGNSSAVLLSELGVSSTDASSHCADARFGVIRHPVTLRMCRLDTTRQRKYRKPTVSAAELHAGCACPVCSAQSWLPQDAGREAFLQRAVHNAFQVKRMIREGVVARQYEGILREVKGWKHGSFSCPPYQVRELLKPGLNPFSGRGTQLTLSAFSEEIKRLGEGAA